MNYIIDGYNLGHKLPNAARHLKQGETDKAIQLILSYIRASLSSTGKIIVVFDGKKGYFPNQAYPAGLTIRFSRKPQTADDIIRNFIRNQAHPKNWTVISSDNEIIYTAQDMGAKVLKTLKSGFSGKKNSASVKYDEKYQPQNVNVQEWLKLFKQGEKE